MSVSNIIKKNVVFPCLLKKSVFVNSLFFRKISLFFIEYIKNMEAK